jgi:hypothetical protein
MSMHRLLWSTCFLATALAPFLGTAGTAQEKDSSISAPEQVWSLEGPWTGVVSDQSTGTIYAIGRGGKCVEVDAAGKSQREFKLPDSSGSILRLATLRGEAKALLTFTVWANELRAYDISGKHLWNYPRDTGIDDVWASDLNGDGSDEVIVGYNGGTGLHVLDGKGQLLWKSTDIGNVWHVCAGDVLGDGKSQVVTTSAAGKVHVFGIDGKKSKDLDAGCYATMVRIGRPSGKEKAATILVAGSALDFGADQKVVILTALSGDGTKRWSLKVPGDTVPQINSAYVAPQRPWLVVGTPGGAVQVVDIEKGRVIASLKDQGMQPEMGWVKGKDAGVPLLLIATGSKLNAFRIPESK